MGNDKWAKVISYLNSVNAKPDKVLNALKTIYDKKSNSSSMYQMLRSSWVLDVVYNIYNKTGTTNKNKKISLRQIIQNWVVTKDYKLAYRTFHPGPKNDQWEFDPAAQKLNLYKDLPIEKHVKNCNDIWLSANGKRYRKDLESNNGKYPIKSKNFPSNRFVEVKNPKLISKIISKN